jgi:hypothetical protein
MRESLGDDVMLFGGLFFAIALGVFGLLFRMWAVRSQQQFSPVLMMALFGGALLGAAIMTVVYAMYSACHGNYDIIRNMAACTYQDTRAHGM